MTKSSVNCELFNVSLNH